MCHLQHISHPSIVSYIHSFTTPTHHCLVLERIEGVELFDVINSDEKYAKMDEPLLRRIWGELCKAVGWLHEVALVHRDIKLESMLSSWLIYHSLHSFHRYSPYERFAITFSINSPSKIDRFRTVTLYRPEEPIAHDSLWVRIVCSPGNHNREEIRRERNRCLGMWCCLVCACNTEPTLRVSLKSQGNVDEDCNGRIRMAR
jgi:serine/threonine protein kinase